MNLRAAAPRKALTWMRGSTSSSSGRGGSSAGRPRRATGSMAAPAAPSAPTAAPAAAAPARPLPAPAPPPGNPSFPPHSAPRFLCAFAPRAGDQREIAGFPFFNFFFFFLQTLPPDPFFWRAGSGVLPSFPQRHCVKPGWVVPGAGKR